MSTGMAFATELTPTRLAYRPALDGLRGVAVVLVVLYHLEVPGFGAGFIGVDVFFVLSGFLITSLLMQEHAARGMIDLKRFWARRARRLLPALIVVVLVTMAAMPSVSVFPTLGDGLASLLYAANWRFIATSQSYFAEGTAITPFRHMWSLAVEEHFYVLWPLVFVVLWRRALRERLVWITIAITGSSVAMMSLYAATNPSRAYFGTDTRIHQILIGIGLAAIMARTRSTEDKGRLLGWAGLAGLVVSLVLLSGQQPGYYFGGAVAIAAAAAALIAAQEASPESRVSRVLSSRTLVELGKRSYGIYLWHWPIIVWLGLRNVEGAALVVIGAGATVVIAWLSYRLLEQPIRHSSSLTNGQTLLAAGAVLAIATASVVGLGSRYTQPAWMTEDAGEMITAGFDSAPRQVVGLIGDSVAASLVPGLEAAAVDRGMALASVASRGCAVTDGRQVEADGTPFTYTDRCDELIPDGVDEMLETKPDIVIWYSGRDSNVHFMVDGEILVPRTPAHDAYVRSSLSGMVERITSTGARLVILDPFQVPREKCTEIDATDRCEKYTERSEAFEHLARILREFRRPGVAVINVDEVICRGDEGCDPTIEGEHLREDGNHFTDEMARFVAPQLLDIILREGLS